MDNVDKTTDGEGSVDGDHGVAGHMLAGARDDEAGEDDADAGHRHHVDTHQG